MALLALAEFSWFAELALFDAAPRAVAQSRSRSARGRSPHGGSTRSRSGRRRARRPRLTAAQRDAIRRRHQGANRTRTRAWLRLDPPPLVLHPANGSETVTLIPVDGRFDEVAMPLAQRAFATREGQTRDIHPRVLELVYRAVRQFRTPYVNMVSGYRAGRPTSRHTQGRAIDFALPGVSDRRLASFLRQQGYVGVGLYPTSGFVHLDVRARSYFWVDSSGPGQANRERAILRDATGRADAAARRRGEQLVPDIATDIESSDEGESATDSASSPADTLPTVMPPTVGVPAALVPEIAVASTGTPWAPAAAVESRGD